MTYSNSQYYQDLKNIRCFLSSMKVMSSWKQQQLFTLHTMAEQCHYKLFQANYLPFPLHLLNILQILSQTDNFRILIQEDTSCCGLMCRRHVFFGCFLHQALSFLRYLNLCNLLFPHFLFFLFPSFLPPYTLKICRKAISKSSCLHFTL